VNLMSQEYTGPTNYYQIRIDEAPNGLDSFEDYVAYYKQNYSVLLKNKVLPFLDKLTQKGLIEKYHFLSHPKSYDQNAKLIEKRPIFDLRIRLMDLNNLEEVKTILSLSTLHVFDMDKWGNKNDTKVRLTILHNVAEIVRSLIENEQLDLQNSEDYEIAIHWLCNVGVVDTVSELEIYKKRLGHMGVRL